ncbi:MAG: CaiB/BaiF CoA-transferase family protein, partial [Candidatus Hydrogenedentota bacterium]
DVVKRMVKENDIVLEQFRPGVMKRLGVDYETLVKENPNIIYCSLTGYGQTGPLRDRAGHDNNYLALAGAMSHSGRKKGGPVPQGVQVADLGAGSYGVVMGILGAVIHRHATGEGQYVDVSMFDGALHWNGYAGGQYFVGGESPAYEEMVLNGGSQYDYYETSDGRYMSVGSLEPQFWKALCEAVGHPEWVEAKTLPGPEIVAIKVELRKIFLSKTQADWVHVFEPLDACVEPVLTLEEAANHPHTKARGLIVDVPKPNGGTQQQIAFPVKFSKSEPRYDHIGSELGAHTEDVLREAGYSDAEIAVMAEAELFGPKQD